MDETREASFKVENGALTITTSKGKRRFEVEELRAVSKALRNPNNPSDPAPILISSRGFRYKLGVYAHPSGAEWTVIIFESALVLIGEVPPRSRITAVEAAIASNPSKNRRHRKCPRCGSVIEAGRLACLTLGANWGSGGAIRQCPICGVQATTSNFALIKVPA